MIKSLSRRLRRLRGFTLTELVIVVGIIGIVMGGIWMTAAHVNTNHEINDAVEEVYSTMNNLTPLLAQRRSLSAMGWGVNNAATGLNAQVIAAKGIDAAWVTGPQTAMNPFSADTNFIPGPALDRGTFVAWNKNDRRIRLSLYEVPVDACAALIKQAINCTPNDPACGNNGVIGVNNCDCPGCKSSEPVCPIYVCTDNCTASMQADTTKGTWNLTASNIDALCSNNPNATQGSVEFDFKF